VWEEYKMFENIAVNKMKLLDELLEEIGDIPVAVWSKHPNVLARIAETYPERLPIVLDGTLSEKEFNSRFMSFLQGDSKLLCLSLGACNQSMDGIQHRCHNNIFFDLSWKPTEFIQSQGRTHRRGQSKLTNFYYLVYKDTLDETVYNMLQEKITHARNVEDLDKNMYDDLVKTIQKKGKLK